MNMFLPFSSAKCTLKYSHFSMYIYLTAFLLRRECCSLSNAEYVKAELAELENWCYDANGEFFFAFHILYYDMCSSPSSVIDTVMAKWHFASSAWDEVKHIRQAIRFSTINGGGKNPVFNDNVRLNVRTTEHSSNGLNLTGRVNFRFEHAIPGLVW